MLSYKTGVYFAPYVRTVLRDSIPRLSLTTGQYALRSSTLCSASLLSSSFRLRSVDGRSFLSPSDFDPLRNLVRFQHQKTKEKLDAESSAETKKSGVDETPGGTKLSRKERLDRAVREYGATVTVLRLSVSLLTMGVTCVAFCNLIDIVGLMTRIGIDQSILESGLAVGVIEFVSILAVAFSVDEITQPAQVTCTLAAAPFVVRFLRKFGILKAPPPKL